MKRSSIIERIYELQEDNSQDKESLTKLFYDVIHNNITIDDAELQLRSIDPSYSRYEFLQNLKGKPVFNNINEYKKGNLDEIQIAKIISSLITQILIQHELNPDVSINSLQIDVLLDLLKEFSETNQINSQKLDYVLSQYGWGDVTYDN